MTPLSKRKLQIVILVCVLACVVLWIFNDSAKSESLEAKYQNWARNLNWHARLQGWEARLPGPLARVLRRTRLRQKFINKADVQEEALLRSGYVLAFSIPLTNESKPTLTQVCASLRKALPDDAVGTWSSIYSNRINITCRTQDVPLCKQALKDY